MSYNVTFRTMCFVTVCVSFSRPHPPRHESLHTPATLKLAAYTAALQWCTKSATIGVRSCMVTVATAQSRSVLFWKCDLHAGYFTMHAGYLTMHGHFTLPNMQPSRSTSSPGRCWSEWDLHQLWLDVSIQQNHVVIMYYLDCHAIPYTTCGTVQLQQHVKYKLFCQ